MFDWQAIGTHAVEMLVGGVGTWIFTSLKRCQRGLAICRKDLDAAFQKIRTLEKELDHAGTDERDRQ